MKRILIVSLLILSACATPPKQTSSIGFVNPTTTEKAPFLEHTEEKPMKAYLAMNLPYAPYQALFEEVQKKDGVILTTRGEAHITVVTPVEYDKVLKKHLSIAEIHKIAQAANIQEVEFTPVCIGRGQKEINGKLEKTYFVVVDSQALIDLRGQIDDAFVKNGGKPQQFVPERFLPHVTLGFTARDLHHEDGVIKNRSSCVYQFNDKN